MKAVHPRPMSLKGEMVARSTWMPGNLSESLGYGIWEGTGSWTTIFSFEERNTGKGSTPRSMLIWSQPEAVPWLWKLQAGKQIGLGAAVTSVLFELGKPSTNKSTRNPVFCDRPLNWLIITHPRLVPCNYNYYIITRNCNFDVALSVLCNVISLLQYACAL